MPSVWSSSTGWGAPPSAASAQGKMPPSTSRKLLVATGTLPRASIASCSLRPTSTTRWGSAVISVLPYLCSIVTGYAPAAADGAPDAGPEAGADGAGEPQAVAPRVRARARAAPQHSRRAGVARGIGCLPVQKATNPAHVKQV